MLLLELLLLELLRDSRHRRSAGLETLLGRSTSLEALLRRSAGLEALLGRTAGLEALLGRSAGLEALLGRSAGLEALLRSTGLEALLRRSTGLEALLRGSLAGKARKLRLQLPRALQRLHAGGLRRHAGEASVLLAEGRLSEAGGLGGIRARRLLLLLGLLAGHSTEGAPILLVARPQAVAAQERVGVRVHGGRLGRWRGDERWRTRKPEPETPEAAKLLDDGSSAGVGLNAELAMAGET